MGSEAEGLSMDGEQRIDIYMGTTLLSLFASIRLGIAEAITPKTFLGCDEGLVLIAGYL